MPLSFAIIYILFLINSLLASAAYAMKLKKEDAKKKRLGQPVEQGAIVNGEDLKRILTEKSRDIIDDCTYLGTNIAKHEVQYVNFFIKFCRLVAARVSTIFMRTGCEISYFSVRSYRTGKESAHDLMQASVDIYQVTKEPIKNSFLLLISACKAALRKAMTGIAAGCKTAGIVLWKYGKKGAVLSAHAIVIAVKMSGEVMAFILLKAAELLVFTENVVKKEVPVLVHAFKENAPVLASTVREKREALVVSYRQLTTDEVL